jgi:DNA-binding MarR family transcriptional regulator
MVALPSDPLTAIDLTRRWGVSKQAVHKWIDRIEAAGFQTWTAGRTIIVSDRQVTEFERRLKVSGDLAPGERKRRRKT